MNIARPPKLFPLSVLTAAVQYPGISPEQFDKDPIGAALEACLQWINTAREISLNGIQLSAALAKPDAYLPPEQMLDPVASHGPWRTLPDGTGEDLSAENVEKIIDACLDEIPMINIYDIGFFENLLHPYADTRKQIHEHLLRSARASKLLKTVGCRGVTTFIGSDTSVSIDENLLIFEEEIIPLLREFDELDQILWIENCPMPGWTPEERYMQNIACTPFMWAIFSRIAEKHGLRHVLRITYDASHSILMGSRPIWDFLYLKAIGKPWLIDRFHGKAQNRRVAKVAAHTIFGQRAGTGIFDCKNRKLFTDPRVLGNAWRRMTAEHTLPGLSQYNAWTNFNGQTVDWLEHQIGARSILGIEPTNSVFHIEHEWGPARDQNLDRVAVAIQLSARYMGGIDSAADANSLGEEWCQEVGLPWELMENPLERIPGLAEAREELESINI